MFWSDWFTYLTFKNLRKFHKADKKLLLILRLRKLIRMEVNFGEKNDISVGFLHFPAILTYLTTQYVKDIKMY